MDLAAGLGQRLPATDPVDTGTALAAAAPLLPTIAAVLGDDVASARQQTTGAMTVVEQQLL